MRDLEQRLTRALGTKVEVRDRGNKGEIAIPYADLDALDRLIDKLALRRPVVAQAPRHPPARRFERVREQHRDRHRPDAAGDGRDGAGDLPRFVERDVADELRLAVGQRRRASCRRR